jgi:hypothetical protein
VPKPIRNSLRMGGSSSITKTLLDVALTYHTKN